MTELAITLVRAWPGGSEELALALPAGARVGDALAAARAAGWPIDDGEAGRLAVFGRRADAATALDDGDRVELLRPLLADPMQRRRERAAPWRRG